MKKKVILLIIVLIIFSISLFLLINEKKIPKNLVCSGEDTLIMTNANVKYTFSGKDGIAYNQQIDVKVYTDDEALLNNYKDIITGNFDCMDIELNDLVLSYTCKYDLTKNKYLFNLFYCGFFNR